MKKVLFTLVVLSLFLLKIDGVYAMTGEYTYDINSVSLEGPTNNESLKISGWAYITEDGRATHNINPTFTMRIEANTPTGPKVITYGKDKDTATGKDIAPGVTTFAAKGSNPNDYTRPYYTRHYTDLDGDGSLETSLTYPDYDPSFASKTVDPRTSAIDNSSKRNHGEFTSYFAINLNFEFSIPLKDITTLAKAAKDQGGKAEVSIYLTDTLTKGTQKVYGKDYNQNGGSWEIPIALQEKVFDSKLLAKLKAKPYNMTFRDNLTEVTTVVERGQAQSSAKFGNTNYYFYANSRVVEGSSSKYGSYPSLYYYNYSGAGGKAGANYEDEAKYGVDGISQKKANDGGLPASNNPVNYYLTHVSPNPGDECWGGVCLIYNKNSTIQAYIPAFWVTPVKGSMSIIVVDVVTDPCDIDKIKIECTASNPSACTKYKSSTCCSNVCSNTANGSTYFCTNTCSTPVPPTETLCNSSDPEKVYCCNYPNDPVCKIIPGNSGGDSFPTPSPDPSENKDGTCSMVDNTTIDFKYPAEGWGKTLLTNNACSISCQEKLRATFEPTRSVRAGMGFTYPVNVSSSRYCTAQYDNAGWKAKVDSAATSANTAYANMVAALKEAERLDRLCGKEQPLTAPVPSCPSPYTDSRSGLTCYDYMSSSIYYTCSSGTLSGSDCITKSSNNYTVQSTNSYSYICNKGSVSKSFTGCSGNCNAPSPGVCGPASSSSSCPSSCTSGGSCSTTYSKSCTVTTSSSSPADIHYCQSGYTYHSGNSSTQQCVGSTSISCPSISGHSSSYDSSHDRCEVSVCKENYSKLWSTAQSEIRAQINLASSYRSSYSSYTSTVNSLNTERNTCDNYVSNNTYTGATNTKIAVDVPNQSSYSVVSTSRSEDASYEGSRSSTSTNYQIYQCNTSNYTAPSLIGGQSTSSFSGNYCNFQTATRTYKDFWNKKSNANVGLEFSTPYYVQRYTGDISTVYSSGYDYDGRYSYTDFYEASGLNGFSLSVTKLGPNLPTVSNSLWSITPFTCQYNVDNMIFPPKGDPNNAKYGNVAFMYRQISLTTPFPNRSPGENWAGKTALITSNEYKVYANKPLYLISLSPSTMQMIRGYGTNYASFNANNPYISNIIQTYINNGTIIKGK